jgi:ATP-dependent RNA helicase DHX36
MVGRLLPKRMNDKRLMVETAGGAKVRLHQRSSNVKVSSNKSIPLIIYDEITRGDGSLYIKNSSIVSPFPVLLLSNEMVVAPPPEEDEWETDDGEGSEEDEEPNGIDPGHGDIMSEPDNDVTVVVDRWLKFQSTALDVAQIYCLRERLASAILYKVCPPHCNREGTCT